MSTPARPLDPDPLNPSTDYRWREAQTDGLPLRRRSENERAWYIHTHAFDLGYTIGRRSMQKWVVAGLVIGLAAGVFGAVVFR